MPKAPSAAGRTRPALERSGWALARLRWLALSVLASLAALPQRGASEALFFVPVYEWVLVWKDWRNPNYKMGSLWRPKMIAQYNPTDFPGEMNRRIDGYDVRGFVSAKFEVIFFGDVFMPGHEPPNFVGTTILVDLERDDCPTGLPCLARDKETAKFKALLFVTPDRNLFETIWKSKLKQCTVQNELNVPQLCGKDTTAAIRGLCEVESGYAKGETPITIQRPSCPNDYYVLGHLALLDRNGTNNFEVPMPMYKCIHESLLRKGSWPVKPAYTGGKPETSPWNPSLKSVEWQSPLSLWHANCGQPDCGPDPFCVDTFSRGLFYANDLEDVYNDQLTGEKDKAPRAGPRCFNMFRDCVGRDGVGTNVVGETWDLKSDCDFENGKRKASSGDAPLRGVYQVLPSGIPTYSPTPIEIVFNVDPYLCNYIQTFNDDIDSQGFGSLLINGKPTEWRSVVTMGTFCEIRVKIELDGSLKTGPARVEIEAQTVTANRVIVRDVDAVGLYPYWRVLGRSIGRLYVYNDPSANATIIEPRAVNNNDCQLNVVVRMPPFTNAIQYNQFVFCSWKQPGLPDWVEGEQPELVQFDHLGMVGFLCKLPQITDETLYLRISFNADIDGIGTYHDIAAPVTRFGQPWSDIPNDGALRLYGVTPKSGPEEGGTLVTVFGQYFSRFCDKTQYCNAIQCHFKFPLAGGITVYAVDATMIDDKKILCVTPRAKPFVWAATLEISIDMNPACGTREDDPLGYNRVNFVYQTANTVTAIPAEGPRNPDVTSTPFRLQGEWNRCDGNISSPYYHDCQEWPGINEGDSLADKNVDGLGYYSCLGGMYDENGTSTSVKYPVWCLRALPVNAAGSYFFTLTDPFFNIIASVLRPVPKEYPGYCHRTSHHFGFDRLSHNLDYRYFDLFDKNYTRGKAPVPGKITQGRNLIDRIWSTTALNSTIPYMRRVMHEIGEKYGFIDLGIVFSISLDFTLTSAYNERVHRRTQRCAKPPARFAPYSGELADEGDGGSFVNWTAHAWEDGRASCSVNPRWQGKCEQTIVKSPNKPDDTGVMLTRPSSLELQETVKDTVLACGRMRVAFDCSSFSLSKCIGELVLRDVPLAQYRNTGSRQEYDSFESWCFFMYPEAAGPNNPTRKTEKDPNRKEGWNAEKPVEGDWRYLYRHSPCVRCRQAQEMCSALDKGGSDSIVDGVPGPPQRRSFGDKSAAAEITLGCFGPPDEPLPVEDECCDDALDNLQAPPIRGKCPRSLERCVRPGVGYLCAKDDDRDGICSDRELGEWPLCAPRNLV